MADQIPAFARIPLATYLIPPGSRVLVAVSAGIDSCVLAHVLSHRRKELGITLGLAYIHHGLRPEAEEESLLVNFLAGSLHCDFYSAKIEVGHGAGIQDRARRLRYEALEKIADERGFDLIATAHHGDDQAETVLFRALRGSGISGLSGIAPRKGRVIRPFLFATRSQIEDYAEAKDVSFLEDASNLKDSYTRNRLRRRAIPYLSEVMGQDVTGPLCRLAELARIEGETLREIAEQDLKEAQSEARWTWDFPLARKHKFEIALDTKTISGLSQGRRYGLFRAAVFRSKGDLLRVGLDHIMALETLTASANPSGRVEIPGGVLVRRCYELLFFETGEQPRPPEPIEITSLGSYFYGNLEFRLTNVQSPAEVPQENPLMIYLGPEPVQYPIRIRSRKPGDKIKSAGSENPVSLKKEMIDKKVPKFLRDFVPIIEDGRGICWVPGLYTLKLQNSFERFSGGICLLIVETK